MFGTHNQVAIPLFRRHFISRPVRCPGAKAAENQALFSRATEANRHPDLCSSRVSESMSQTASELLTPKTSSDYVPLSARCKFDLFLRQTYSPYTFASAGFQATLAQATAQWPHYGGGVQGWGKRFCSTLADPESRRFIQGFALSTVLHQDPRYFPSNKKRILARIWYAATRVIVVKSDQGRGTFNSAEFLGALFTSSLENAYYPRPDRTFGAT